MTFIEYQRLAACIIFFDGTTFRRRSELNNENATNNMTCLQNDIIHLHYWIVPNSSCSVVIFSLERTHEHQGLMIRHNRKKHRNIARDLRLEVEGHLKWTEHVKAS